jgi:glycosyltransferase involved in cell wall biosynthesis
MMTLQIVVDGSVFNLQPYGGISNAFNETLPRICELNADVDIYLVLRPQIVSRNIPEHLRIKKIIIPPINTLRPRRIWRYFTSPSLNHFYKKQIITCFVSDRKRTIYHSTYFETMPGWHGPQVVSVYDLIHEKYPHLFRENIGPETTKKALAIRSANWLLCISETTRNDLLEYYGISENKTQVIHLSHNKIYSRRIEPRITTIDFPFILYIGNRGRYKGFEDFLDAYSRWKYNKDIHIIVTGPDWNLEEIGRIRELNLENKITLMPNISDDIQCDLYNQALAFVYPSYYEGFGIPLLEAMACACPIVASKIPSTLEIAENIPFYFNSGKLDELNNALNQAISVEKNSNRVEQGLKRSQQFSWDITARKTLEFYRRIIE